MPRLSKYQEFSQKKLKTIANAHPKHDGDPRAKSSLWRVVNYAEAQVMHSFLLMIRVARVTWRLKKDWQLSETPNFGHWTIHGEVRKEDSCSKADSSQTALVLCFPLRLGVLGSLDFL